MFNAVELLNAKEVDDSGHVPSYTAAAEREQIRLVLFKPDLYR